jgi:ethanolamine utilization microcompartment shell protein EutL
MDQKELNKRAGDLHDKIHEVAALVNTKGVEVGWAPEDAIPILAKELNDIRNEALEEAAKIAESQVVYGYSINIAAAIRAKKGILCTLPKS